MTITLEFERPLGRCILALAVVLWLVAPATAEDLQWEPLRRLFRLTHAEALGVDVNASLVTATFPEAVGPVTFVVVEFPSLTKPQYDGLMSHYGGDGSVPWQPDGKRSYRLVDFLPPKMQALLNCTIDAAYHEAGADVIPTSWRDPRHPDSPTQYTYAMCCWDAVFEVTRPGPGSFFHIGAVEAEGLFQESGCFVEVGNLSSAEIAIEGDKVGRNRDRRPGDVLYIRNQFSTIGPAHVAIWLDDDLYFEKPNSYTEDPFRLARYEDVISPYLLEGGAVDDTIHGTFYRVRDAAGLPSPHDYAGIHPYGEDVEPLPPASAKSFIFALDVGLGGGLSNFNISRIVDFEMGRSADGRAVYVGAEKYGLKRVIE